MLSRAKLFVERYERRLSSVAFVAGFIWDTLMLTRVDRLLDNIVLASYLVMAFASIILINAHGSGRHLQGGLSRRGVSFARFLLPFSFGGLFSGLLIFYSRSGLILSSAPFLLILTALFLGNEFFRRHYQRFIFQMSVFFVTLFSYAALIIPVLSGEMGDVVFVVSGLSALFLFWLALRVVALVAGEEVDKSRYALWVIVAGILITFNALYFNNMIPPIPLSLKEIGVYHAVSRTRSGAYALSFEKPSWYQFGAKTSKVFHARLGERVYVFSSVFAPARLDTEILHRWSKFDEKKREWVSFSVIAFPIWGGRDEGYRGYSMKESLFPGTWRVDVETPRGQIIGRFVFTVKDAEKDLVLKTETR